MQARVDDARLQPHPHVTTRFDLSKDRSRVVSFAIKALAVVMIIQNNDESNDRDKDNYYHNDIEDDGVRYLYR